LIGKVFHFSLNSLPKTILSWYKNQQTSNTNDPRIAAIEEYIKRGKNEGKLLRHIMEEGEEIGKKFQARYFPGKKIYRMTVANKDPDRNALVKDEKKSELLIDG